MHNLWFWNHVRLLGRKDRTAREEGLAAFCSLPGGLHALAGDDMFFLPSNIDSYNTSAAVVHYQKLGEYVLRILLWTGETSSFAESAGLSTAARFLCFGRELSQAR